MLLTKNHIFVGHLGFHATEKILNTYKLAYIGFGLSTHLLTENNKKTLYMSKNKVMCPLAGLCRLTPRRATPVNIRI